MVCENKSQCLALLSSGQPAPSQNSVVRSLSNQIHYAAHTPSSGGAHLRHIQVTFFERRLAPLDVSIFLVDMMIAYQELCVCNFNDLLPYRILITLFHCRASGKGGSKCWWLLMWQLGGWTFLRWTWSFSVNPQRYSPYSHPPPLPPGFAVKQTTLSLGTLLLHCHFLASIELEVSIELHVKLSLDRDTTH